MIHLDEQLLVRLDSIIEILATAETARATDMAQIQETIQTVSSGTTDLLVIVACFCGILVVLKIFFPDWRK